MYLSSGLLLTIYCGVVDTEVYYLFLASKQPKLANISYIASKLKNRQGAKDLNM